MQTLTRKQAKAQRQSRRDLAPGSNGRVYSRGRFTPSPFNGPRQFVQEHFINTRAELRAYYPHLTEDEFQDLPAYDYVRFHESDPFYCYPGNIYKYNPNR